VTTTLLAIDDSKTMRKVLEITFAGEDYRTVLAETPIEGLAKLRSENPAVALVDANLGDESGYDLCQKIKREAPGVGVLILSSKQQPYDRTRGTSAGADDFMDKPFDTQQLIEKVGALVRRAAEGPLAAAKAVPAAPPVAQRPAAATAPGLGVRPVSPAASPAAVQPQRTGTSPGVGVRPLSVQSPGQHAPQAAPIQPRPVVSARPAVPAAVPVSPAQPPAAPRPPSSPQAAPPPAPAQARPAAPAPAVAAPVAPAPTPAALPAAVAVAAALPADLDVKLLGLGLTKDQVSGVLALSKDVVERVVWEVVPMLAEALIKEEIKRLTSD
jgi:CheY-like chemotaxis protein